MKKIILAGFLTVLILIFAACSAEDAKSEPGGGTSSVVQTQEESTASHDNSAAVSTRPPSFTGEAGTENAVYTQQTSDGTEGAAITFMADGTFEFRPVFYDGSPSVTGSYETTDNAHILTAQETTAHNIILEELGAISFCFDGDRLIYQGTAIGETSDGAVFAP